MTLRPYRLSVATTLAMSLAMALAVMSTSCATMGGSMAGVPADAVWDDLGVYSEGLLAVRYGERWGYASPGGALAIVPQFAEARPFYQGLAAVRLSARWGYTDRNGRYMVLPTYLDAGDFSENLAPVRTEGGWGFIDRAGRMAIKPAYDQAGAFSGGLAPVRLGSRWGYIDRAGALAIGFEFKAAGAFAADLAPVAIMQDDNEWGYIGRSGTFKIKPAFDGARSFSGDMAAVLLDGRWGYIDRRGHFALNPRHDAVESFAGSLAPVKDGGLWGLMYEDGRFYVQPRWVEMGPYHEGRSRVVSAAGEVRSIDILGVEAALRADYAKAAGPHSAPGVGKTGTHPEVTLRVRVMDFITGTPVAAYEVSRIITADGEHELPQPRPRSGADGVLLLPLDAAMAAGVVELLGSAPGYREVPLDVSGKKPSYDLALLPLAAGMPSIDEVLLTRVSDGSKEAVNVLMQQEEFAFRKPGTQRVSFNVQKGPFTIRKYFLQQGSTRVESDRPEFELGIGNRFVKDETIHAGVIISYRDTMVVMPTHIVVRNPPELEKPITLKDVPEMKMPKDVKFLGGMTGGLKIPGLQIDVSYEDDLVTIIIGGQLPTQRNEQTKQWENGFKAWVKEMGEQKDYFKSIWGYLLKNKPKPPTSGSGALSASIGAVGYIELSYGKSGELRVMGGRLVVVGSYGFEYSGQTMIGFIPAYASFGVGGELSIMFKGEEKREQTIEEFFSDVTLTLSPYVDFEGGVGVKGILSVGVGLHGDMPITYTTRPVSASGDAIVDIQIRARLLFVFHWEYMLARGKFHLFGPGSGVEGGTDPSAGFGAADFSMGELTILPGASLWLGDQSPPLLSGGEPLVQAQPLKTNILPGSEPVLVGLGNTEFLFWTDAAPGRDRSSNAAALFFSIRNPDASWTTPRMVHDDGTADYDFAVLEHRGKLYVAWQNTARAFTEDKVDYATVCRNSQILVAVYDPATKAFGAPKHIDGPVDRNYYGRPRLASDGVTMALSYVRNNEGDYFLQSGSTFLYYVRMDKDAWVNALHPLHFPDRPVTGYDLAVKDGKVYAITAEDQDGSFDTVDDRVIYLTYSDYNRESRHVEHRSAVAERKGGFSNPRVVRHDGVWSLFYYGADDKGAKGNYYYHENLFGALGAGSRKSVFAASALLNEDFSLLVGPGKRLGLVYTDALPGAKDPLETAPVFIMYDEAGRRWSLPVAAWDRNPDHGMKVEALRGIWLDPGRIDLAYRTLPTRLTWNPDDKKDSVPTKLAFASIVPAPELAIEPSAIYRYYEPEVAGGLVNFDVDITNKGLLPARGIYTDILRPGNHSLGFQKAYRNLVIHPGETVRLPMEFRLDGRVLGGLVSVRTIKGKEPYTANNSARITFMDPKLGFGDIDMLRSGFKRRFMVDALNRSAVRINDVVLHLYDITNGSTELRRVEVGTLLPNKSARVELEIALQDLQWGDAQRKVLRFELSSPDVLKGGVPGETFVVINPYAYPAFGLSVFDARVSGTRLVYVSAAATNNHPVTRSGDLLIELEDGNGVVEVSRSIHVRAEAGATAMVAQTFSVKGDPRSYTVRVSMKNAPRAAVGAAESGGLTDVGGDPTPVEVPVGGRAGPGTVYQATSGRGGW